MYLADGSGYDHVGQTLVLLDVVATLPGDPLLRGDNLGQAGAVSS